MVKLLRWQLLSWSNNWSFGQRLSTLFGGVGGPFWAPCGLLLRAFGGLGGTKEAWRPLRGSKKRARGPQEGPKRSQEASKRPPRALLRSFWGRFCNQKSVANAVDFLKQFRRPSMTIFQSISTRFSSIFWCFFGSFLKTFFDVFLERYFGSFD